MGGHLPPPAEYAVTVTNGGNGTASATPRRLPCGPGDGDHPNRRLSDYRFKGGRSRAAATITDNKFIMPEGNGGQGHLRGGRTCALAEYTVTVTKHATATGPATASPLKLLPFGESTPDDRPSLTEGYRAKEGGKSSTAAANGRGRQVHHHAGQRGGQGHLPREDLPPAPTSSPSPATDAANTTTPVPPQKLRPVPVTLAANPTTATILRVAGHQRAADHRAISSSCRTWAARGRNVFERTHLLLTNPAKPNISVTRNICL